MRASLWAGIFAGGLVGAAEAFELLVRGQAPGSISGFAAGLLALVAVDVLAGAIVGAVVGLGVVWVAPERPWAAALRGLLLGLAGVPGGGLTDARVSEAPRPEAAPAPDSTLLARRVYGAAGLIVVAVALLYGLARFTEQFSERQLAAALLAVLSVAGLVALLLLAPAWHAGLGRALRLFARIPFAGVLARTRAGAAAGLVLFLVAGALLAARIGGRAHADLDLGLPVHLVALVALALALRALGAAGGRPAAWVRLARTPGGGRSVALAATPIAALLLAAAFLGLSAGARTALSRAALASRGAALLRTASDVDRDGYSSLFGGGDCAAFDGFLHPGARDLPGNGVDEDCSGADFVLGDRAAAAEPPPVPLPPGFRPIRNVLFITVDTLRADHLRFLGYERDTSPALDRLAGSGAVFTRAWCSAPRTVRSIPALMTGRYPSSIVWAKAGRDWEDIADSNETLAEVLTRAGFRTAGFVLQKYFLEPRGLYKGMKMSGAAELAPYYLKDESKPSGRHVTDGVVAFLKSLGAGEPASAPAVPAGPAMPAGPATSRAPASAPVPRFFVWAHYYDPHIKFHEGRFGKDRVALYDESIRSTDEDIGKLLDYLRATGLDRETLVVFTADHGQGLGEHGKVGHGSNLYDEGTRVPLVLAGPGIPPFRHETALAEGVDVAPTIAALAGVALPAADGRSLAGRAVLGAAAPPPAGPDLVAYVEAIPDAKTEYDLRAIVRWPHKLVRDLGSGNSEVYDLEADPGERDDRFGVDRALDAGLDLLLAGRVAAGEWLRALGPNGYVTLAPPKPALATNVLVNAFVRVVGVDAPGLRAGAPGAFTLYFTAERPMPAPWKVRTTIIGPGAGPAGCRFTADHDPAEGRHATSHWQRGEFVIDRFKLRIPPGCRGAKVVLHVGFVGAGAPAYEGAVLDAEGDGAEGEVPKKGSTTPPAGPAVAELKVP